VCFLCIADFDTALDLTEDVPLDCVGSVGWMAPEVLDDTGGEYGLAVDIYSFGMLLYELLTLRTPYYDQILMESRCCSVLPSVRLCVLSKSLVVSSSSWLSGDDPLMHGRAYVYCARARAGGGSCCVPFAPHSYAHSFSCVCVCVCVLV
jgi:serine/threonine protein kinase